jgi:hypothetical protein
MALSLHTTGKQSGDFMKTAIILLLTLFFSGCGYTTLTIREPVPVDPVVIVHPRPSYWYSYWYPRHHPQPKVIVIEKKHPKQKMRPAERIKIERRTSGNTRTRNR